MNIRPSLCAVVWILGAGVAHADAPAASPPPPPPHRIVGGYAEQDVNGVEAKENAGYAIDLLRTKQKDPKIALTTIKQFSRQVVAGTNFHFVLDVTTATGAKTVTLVMYQDLKRVRTLSSVSGL